MKHSKIFLLALFLIGMSINGAFAQTFKANFILGMNAGQIDGDFEVGFNKIGISTGIGIGLNLSKNMFLGTEFLFSQRGSKNALFNRQNQINGSINLNYISVPIVYKLLDWYDEEDERYKVWLETGICPGRLINANIKGSNQPDLVNNFRTTDLSWLLGAGYNVNKNIYVGFRYTRSFFPFYRIDSDIPDEVSRLLSYFITLRVGYIL